MDKKKKKKEEEKKTAYKEEIRRLLIRQETVHAIMALSWFRHVCEVFILLEAFGICTPLSLSEHGCSQSRQIVELEEKLSKLKRSLQAVRERIAQVKRDREFQEELSELGKLNKNRD